MYGGKQVKLHSYWQDAKILARDFCRESSIHGFKYLMGSHRALIEKIWWFAVTCISLYGCGSLIHNVFQKWQMDPVIVSFATKPVPVFRIPFPSVTICPEIKVKMDRLNFTQIYSEVIEGTLKEQMDGERVGKLLAMLQVCDFVLYEVFTNETFDDDCVKLLQQMKIPQNEVFLYCQWRDENVDCSEKFRPTLTEKGICYTFNSLSEDDLLRKEGLHSEYAYLDETRPIVNWTLDEGYSPDATRGVYPQRVLGSGISAGLNVMIKANLSDMDYLCSNTFQGFQVLLHTPHEYPQLSQRHFRVPLNQQVVVSVTPDIVTTSEDVKAYQPHRRQCYFDNERYLRFFRIYSQKNCELECLTNYTLEQCGCVKFSMPRPADARICGLSKIRCYKRAAVDILLSNAKMIVSKSKISKDKCDCLPACSTLRYHSELSQSDFQWTKMIPVAKAYRAELQGVQLANLVVLFRDAGFIPVVRRELYGSTDLLANCGGLLGLFMGISILSLVEILYYCSIKPLVIWWKGMNLTPVKQITPIAEYKNPFASKILHAGYQSDTVGKFYLK
ncbi:pickpocket protein 28-like [Culex pipiens pallens]|uniref:pickpocket protein 28-like n=1 Tax=Culex pipiens pallens TaxID=42434 RepID=UPI001954CDA9|nr:pickpocket protein 28-like [Culex pipiens pallens]